jgi:DNA-directed RNA polymerase subunit RPC12/RpoP
MLSGTIIADDPLMTSQVINPCPMCGKRFGFPLTGCMTFVAESLIANSDGKCPACGTTVVVDQPPSVTEPLHPPDALAAAQTETERRNVKIADLPLSVRCRLQIHRMDIHSLGELLQRPKDTVRRHLAGSPNYFDQLQALLDQHGLEWRE